MREPIKYFIEPDWNGKTNSLYLARLEGSVLYTIARFRNPLMAEMFAKDWQYPLSDKVVEIIEKYKQEKGITE